MLWYNLFMSQFEGPSEKLRVDKIAEATVEIFLDKGLVTEERCIELSKNPALRAVELERQKQNIKILLGSDVPDVDSDDLAENVVNFLLLKGLEFDTETKEN